MERQLTLLAAALLLCGLGCAARKPVKPDSAIPVSCVTEAHLTPKTMCHPVDNLPDWYICDGLAVRASCIKYLSK